jgi:ERCC4-type nuclease
MPPGPSGRKVWNEDLVSALRARHQQAWQESKKSQYMWRQGAKTIESMRKDISLTKTGKIFNLPNPGKQNYPKTVYELCQKIIREEAPIFPPGYTPLNPEERSQMEENGPYLQDLKKHGGAYAILLAFHFSARDTMTKDQILSNAQPYSNEAMDSDYFAGRMYGAWKGKDTLVKHDLLTEHKSGPRWILNQGFRSKGKHSFSITPSGKKFIQAMFEKWPDAKIPKSDHLVPPPGSSSPASSAPRAPTTPPHRHSTTPTTTASASKTPNKKSSDDEQGLRDFVLSDGSVGDTKEFKVGKQRRKHLHQLCDRLEQGHPGLRLSHESSGIGRRSLAITIRATPPPTTTSVTPLASFNKVAAAGGDGGRNNNSKKRRHSETIASFDSPGHRLGGAIMVTPNHPRERTAARQAAVGAAVARFTSPEPIRNAAKRKRPPASSLLKSPPPPPPPSPLSSSSSAVICLDDSSSDDDDETDQKPAAISQIDHDRGGSAARAYDLVSEWNHTSNKVTMNNSSSTEVVDLCGEFDTVAASPVARFPIALQNGSQAQVSSTRPFEGSRATNAHPDYHFQKQVTILIDDRERSRNTTPRELRIELTKHMQVGALKAVWPQDLPTAKVVESNLAYGDFAFQITPESDTAPPSRLSIVVERKRVGDLVNRSNSGDHWKQLQRMRDNCEHAIMLIENDTKFANIHDAYGAPVEPRPNHHVIENEQDVFRFIGRAIISSRAIKFLQTRDDRGTFRSIGALALMATMSTNLKQDAPVSPPTAASEQQRLYDRLVSGGIHWRISKAIASEVGSVAAMDRLYGACSSNACELALMRPIVDGMGDREDCPGSAELWSEAICHACRSEPDVRASVKESFEELKGLTSNPSLLLASLYTEDSRDDALDKVFGAPVASCDLHRRRVHIELPDEFQSYFPQPTDASFYSLIATETATPDKVSLVQFTTVRGKLSSSKLVVYVMEGKVLLDLILNQMAGTENDDDDEYVYIAQQVCALVHSMCEATTSSSSSSSSYSQDEDHRRVILIRGLSAAFNVAAKRPGFREESWVVADMAMATLMIEYDYVVLQAVLLQQREVKMILQQLALSCFHYQLLWKEEGV